MNNKQIIKKTEEFVKKKMKGDSGHDWYHIDRVRKNALFIGKNENVDLFIVELAALLHDVGDYKFHGGQDTGGEIARKFLTSHKIESNLVDAVCEIIDNVSFSKSIKKTKHITSVELQVVQDADRLDTLGAIGIARVFAFAGYRNKSLYDPKVKPDLNKSLAKYRKADNTAINHFYEKLLLLKDRMHTKTAKRIALERHKFMEQYLKQFYKEWKGF